jgi:phosphoserine phosphatase RsbU/P
VPILTVKILIADDEPDFELLIRQRFRRRLADGTYDLAFARDGLAALERVRADPTVDLVFTDIHMPGLDGLELIDRLHADYPLLPAVIVSAYGDLANIRSAMNRGAFDFLTKPIDFADFESVIARSLKQRRALQQAAAHRDQLAALQRELDIAAGIQQSILPSAVPAAAGRLDLHATMRPARNVGGDFYDFFALPGGRLGLVVGDVSGKGVPAALFMAMARTLLKAVALRGAEPGDCLTEVNATFCRDHAAEMFATLFYASLDPATGAMLFACGGHPAPVRLTAAGEAAPVPVARDTVVGMLEGLRYQTRRTELAPGDALLLYSDGVTEALNPARQPFGQARLAAYLRANAGRPARELVEGLVEAVQAFAAGAPPSDDLTALAVRVPDS